jgi:hypothetical protein
MVSLNPLGLTRVSRNLDPHMRLAHILQVDIDGAPSGVYCYVCVPAIMDDWSLRDVDVTEIARQLVERTTP